MKVLLISSANVIYFVNGKLCAFIECMQRLSCDLMVTCFVRFTAVEVPRLACRGSVVDQLVTHIRRRVESLNGMNVN